ncbi:MAG: hypothetical protein Q9160_005740 [Pyrenula sp. 1 TL-2023]
MLYFIAFILCFLFISPINSADPPEPPPIQYCNPDPTPDLSYCLALLTHINPQTSKPDLYVTLSTSRARSSGALGWHGIGFGSTMSGALMFVVYGDPSSSSSPTLSIRTTPGHAEPLPIAELSTGKSSISAGFDTQLLSSEWTDDDDPSSTDSDSGSITAHISFVIRSASLWSGASISVTEPLQPFIYAYNPAQQFPSDAFRANAPLEKHDPSHGSGHFYMDLSASFLNTTEPPDPPSIYPGRILVSSLTHAPDFDLSTTEAAKSFRNIMWHVHGILMTLAFIFFLPAGTLAMLSAHPSASFRWHWRLQAVGGVLGVLGMVLGLLLSRAIVLFHQFVGIAVLVAVGVQAWAGWRHHVKYLETGGRTWVSPVHVWLGRVMLCSGWVNLFSGMLLRDYGWGTLTGMDLAVVAEVLLLGWAWDRRRQGRGLLQGRERKGRGVDVDGVREGGDEEEYFALVDQGDEEDSDFEDADADIGKRGGQEG